MRYTRMRRQIGGGRRTGLLSQGNTDAVSCNQLFLLGDITASCITNNGVLGASSTAAGCVSGVCRPVLDTDHVNYAQ